MLCLPLFWTMAQILGGRRWSAWLAGRSPLERAIREGRLQTSSGAELRMGEGRTVDYTGEQCPKSLRAGFYIWFSMSSEWDSHSIIPTIYHDIGKPINRAVSWPGSHVVEVTAASPRLVLEAVWAPSFRCLRAWQQQVGSHGSMCWIHQMDIQYIHCK